MSGRVKKRDASPGQLRADAAGPFAAVRATLHDFLLNDVVPIEREFCLASDHPFPKAVLGWVSRRAQARGLSGVAAAAALGGRLSAADIAVLKAEAGASGALLADYVLTEMCMAAENLQPPGAETKTETKIKNEPQE